MFKHNKNTKLFALLPSGRITLSEFEHPYAERGDS